ncbi:MAG TPA: hypothetical protein VLV45_14060 [Gemmatimonadales bacterium]|jgi:hypothetical protein|nr:hypothetical protein [Gemmatimonadales bacterium]
MWVIAAILLVALMIPIAAILVDSPLGRSVARRLEGPPSLAGGPEMKALEHRMELLETELEDLSRSIAGMHDELQFVQRLLEDPKKKQS